MTAATTKAVVIKAARQAQIETVSTPKLQDDAILVQTKAVALNPTDWKHIDFLASPGARVGCDYSGVVLEVGSKVTNGLKKGDRVWGVVHGSNAVNHEDGGFADIITARAAIQSKIPENLSFEEAATLGVGIFTVGQGLYQSLGLPLPSTTQPVTATGNTILIYGGSTATGALAIQFAKLSGFHVVTTASPRNFEYLTALGADKVFDYNSPTVAADIRAYSKDSIKHVFDCVSEGGSFAISAASISPEGGVYSALLGVDKAVMTAINPNIVIKNTFAYTVIGKAYKMGDAETPAIPEDFEFAKSFAVLSNTLLGQGKVKVHTPSVNEQGTGLEGVLKGLDLLRNGKVSGKKLVYTL
ncbi:chaperonin 10-like protein [Obelidium mucronatum]|nr:chaperonin 10-like protein [Obelidium mucronatum]